MAAHYICSYLGMDPIVLRYQYGESCNAVFQDWKPFLHMVLAVHSQLGGTASGRDNDIFKCP